MGTISFTYQVTLEYCRVLALALRLITVRYGIGPSREQQTIVVVVVVGLESVLLQMSPVHGEMTAEFVGTRESLWAVGPGAHVGLLSGVRAHVGFQVIGSGELSLADFALERPHSGVLPAMASQLVGPGEPLAATLVVASVWFLACVLPDVHLQVRELQISLGAPGVEAHKRLSLLLGFDGLVLGNQGPWLLSDLRHDESWVGRHGHLDGRRPFVNVSVTRHGGRDEFHWERESMVCWNDAGVGKGEDGAPAARADHGAAVVWVVLKWNRGCCGHEHARYRSLDRRREVRKLRVLLGLVRTHQCLLRDLRFHVLDRGVHRGVVGAELLVRDGRTGVHGGRVGRRAQFLVLEGQC